MDFYAFLQKIGPVIPIIIAALTFLWYRSRRLWKFYWSFFYKAKEQILNSSIDKKSWEEIEENQIQTLSNDIFGCLFFFEMDFLRYLAKKITDELCIPDSVASTACTIKYKDKEKYCEHVFLKILYNHFIICGLWLFIHSIIYSFTKLIKNETGFKKIRQRP